MPVDRSTIRRGMAVYSADGEKLGKVASCDATSFTIEKGFFFPKDYLANYDQVAGVTGDDIRLATTKDSFETGERGGERVGTTAASAGTRSGTEEVRVPVAEEELDVVKRDREAGEVRVRKDVVTETKHIDVPVTREEVHVERAPVSERRDTVPGERAFERDTVSMPVHEEEVEIRKRPVVKEEVRLRKDRVTEQRAAEADVRKERVEVEGGDSSRIRGEEEVGASARRDVIDPSTGMAPRDDEIP